MEQWHRDKELFLEAISYLPVVKKAFTDCSLYSLLSLSFLSGPVIGELQLIHMFPKDCDLKSLFFQLGHFYRGGFESLVGSCSGTISSLSQAEFGGHNILTLLKSLSKNGCLAMAGKVLEFLPKFLNFSDDGTFPKTRVKYSNLFMDLFTIGLQWGYDLLRVEYEPILKTLKKSQYLFLLMGVCVSNPDLVFEIHSILERNHATKIKEKYMLEFLTCFNHFNDVRCISDEVLLFLWDKFFSQLEYGRYTTRQLLGMSPPVSQNKRLCFFRMKMEIAVRNIRSDISVSIHKSQNYNDKFLYYIARMGMKEEFISMMEMCDDRIDIFFPALTSKLTMEVCLSPENGRLIEIYEYYINRVYTIWGNMPISTIVCPIFSRSNYWKTFLGILRHLKVPTIFKVSMILSYGKYSDLSIIEGVEIDTYIFKNLVRKSSSDNMGFKFLRDVVKQNVEGRRLGAMMEDKYLLKNCLYQLTYCSNFSHRKTEYEHRKWVIRIAKLLRCTFTIPLFSTFEYRTLPNHTYFPYTSVHIMESSLMYRLSLIYNSIKHECGQ